MNSRSTIRSISSTRFPITPTSWQGILSRFYFNLVMKQLEQSLLRWLYPKSKTEKKPVKEKEAEVEKSAKKTTKTKEEDAPVEKEIKPVVAEKEVVSEEKKEDFLATKFQKLEGPKILGKMELPVEKKPTPNPNAASNADKKKRKRIRKGGMTPEEIKKVALTKKEALGVTDKSKSGQLTGAIMKELAGKADGGDVKAVVDELLAT